MSTFMQDGVRMLETRAMGWTLLYMLGSPKGLEAEVYSIAVGCGNDLKLRTLREATDMAFKHLTLHYHVQHPTKKRMNIVWCGAFVSDPRIQVRVMDPDGVDVESAKENIT